ncbi:hypothetical protein [Streptomyces sp. NPDC048473]|uniref:hypothetical protein n=1 Tax=unclassified Streptomyces TaxID=2593676 RepID=UPI00371F6DBA
MTKPVTPGPATLLVRDHIARSLRPGATLPSARSLAHGTGLSDGEVKTALHQLNDLGIICYQARERDGRRVLSPGQPHPHDTEVIATIRERIRNMVYRPGEALPVGLLAHQDRLTAHQVIYRACRQLIDEGLVHHDDQGPHGRGVYVAHRPKSPAPPACAPPSTPDPSAP